MADTMDVSGSTILLVDDNPVSSKFIGLILKKIAIIAPLTSRMARDV